jgi:hypothetical protein
MVTRADRFYQQLTFAGPACQNGKMKSSILLTRCPYTFNGCSGQQKPREYILKDKKGTVKKEAKQKDKCSIEQAVLGQTMTRFDLVTQEDVRIAALSLARQSRHSLKIFSYDLEQAIYGNEEFVKSVANVARLHRSTFVHVLIQDPMSAVKNGHQLIEEAHRLTSNIIIRRTSKDYSSLTESFLLADETGILLRQHRDNYDGKLMFHRGPEVIKYLSLFSRAWEASEPEPEFRRLGL